jgi:16S rRNA (cytosine1402-N4)-methyltransferase
MNPSLAVVAADLVNGLGKRELFELFVKLGQVEKARAVTEEIVRARREKPIKTTAELAGVIEKVLPRRGKLHPATKVFMALRMAVNDELGSLERALPQAAGLLAPGGRLAVISFHEGEDRIVKRFFRESSAVIPADAGIYFDRFRVKPGMTEVNKKPIRPGSEEVKLNPRARSAKLRIAEKVNGKKELMFRKTRKTRSTRESEDQKIRKSDNRLSDYPIL